PVSGRAGPCSGPHGRRAQELSACTWSPPAERNRKTVGRRAHHGPLATLARPRPGAGGRPHCQSVGTACDGAAYHTVHRRSARVPLLLPHRTHELAWWAFRYAQAAGRPPPRAARSEELLDDCLEAALRPWSRAGSARRGSGTPRAPTVRVGAHASVV